MPTNFWQQILIGLLFLQGIVQKPENGMYFSKRESILTNNDREKIPSSSKVPSLWRQFQI